MECLCEMDTARAVDVDIVTLIASTSEVIHVGNDLLILPGRKSFALVGDDCVLRVPVATRLEELACSVYNMPPVVVASARLLKRDARIEAVLPVRSAGVSARRVVEVRGGRVLVDGMEPAVVATGRRWVFISWFLNAETVLYMLRNLCALRYAPRLYTALRSAVKQLAASS